MLLFCLNCIKLKHMPEGPFWATRFSLYSSSSQVNLENLLKSAKMAIFHSAVLTNLTYIW